MSNPKPDCAEFAAALDRWMEHMRSFNAEVEQDPFASRDHEHEQKVSDEMDKEERRKGKR
jgi:hypothetical protein